MAIYLFYIPRIVLLTSLYYYQYILRVLYEWLEVDKASI